MADDIRSDGAAGLRRPSPRPVVALVLLAAAVFLVSSWGVLGAPFGDSHDGRNAGTWGAGSRSLREQGPVRSRLGARSPEIGTYAHHPPLIYVQTALAEAAGRGSPAATRAPAWIGSLVALALLARLLLDRGLGAAATGVAVAVVAATPMFLVYGSMLDTPVTSLPFGVGLVLLWLRAVDGPPVRTVHPALAAGAAALAALAGWQSFLVAAVVGTWAVLRMARRRGGRQVELAFAGGALAGAVLLLGWLLWSSGGSLRPLVDQYRFRTSRVVVADAATMGDVVAVAARDAATLYGAAILLLGAAGLVMALRDRRTRALTAVVLAVTVPYGLVFRMGTVIHDYWNYWFLLPLAVGLAVGADRLVVWWPRAERAMVAGAVAVVVVLAAGVAVNPPAARRVVQRGIPAGRLVADIPTLDHTQRSAWFAGAVGEPASWLAVAARRPAVAVRPGELRRLAADHPDDLVLVGRAACVDGRTHTTFAFERAVETAAHPPSAGGCR